MSPLQLFKSVIRVKKLQCEYGCVIIKLLLDAEMEILYNFNMSRIITLLLIFSVNQMVDPKS